MRAEKFDFWRGFDLELYVYALGEGRFGALHATRGVPVRSSDPNSGSIWSAVFEGTFYSPRDVPSTANRSRLLCIVVLTIGADMIEAFSLSTAHLFQDALASQARLRYRVFVEQRGLPHRYHEDLEFDEFDTPAAVYLVWRDDRNIVRGLIRLLRTDRPYMLKSYWPHLVREALPQSADIWEITRVCVDKTVAPEIRRAIIPELLCAVAGHLELCAGEGIVGVTRAHLLSHFIRRGIQWLGQPDEIEGEVERAFFVPREFIRPEYHCRKYGIGRVNIRSGEFGERAA